MLIECSLNEPLGCRLDRRIEQLIGGFIIALKIVAVKDPSKIKNTSNTLINNKKILNFATMAKICRALHRKSAHPMFLR
jgi:hypothetical protein